MRLRDHPEFVFAAVGLAIAGLSLVVPPGVFSRFLPFAAAALIAGFVVYSLAGAFRASRSRRLTTFEIVIAVLMLGLLVIDVVWIISGGYR